MNTTLGIPVWDDQVSTTFDFARKLLIVAAEGEREVSRKEAVLGDEPVDRKARKLRDLGVQVVLCGAVSQPLAQAVFQVGIRIVPYISGQVDDVLGAYLCGRLSEPRFMQPGCRPGARKRWRHGCGYGGAAGYGRM